MSRVPENCLLLVGCEYYAIFSNIRQTCSSLSMFEKLFVSVMSGNYALFCAARKTCPLSSKTKNVLIVAFSPKICRSLRCVHNALYYCGLGCLGFSFLIKFDTLDFHQFLTFLLYFFQTQGGPTRHGALRRVALRLRRVASRGATSREATSRRCDESRVAVRRVAEQRVALRRVASRGGTSRGATSRRCDES